MPEAHLSRVELVVWRDEGTGDRERIVAHLAACAACRAMAAEVERDRPPAFASTRFDAREFAARGYSAGKVVAASPVSRRWPWLAAAASLAVLLLLPLALQRFGDSPRALRGGEERVTLVRPVDASVAAADLIFEWTRESGADQVRVQVFDLEAPGQPLIVRDVDGTRYEPTAEERARLPRGRPLHWFVEFRNAGGVTMTTPAARFTVD